MWKEKSQRRCCLPVKEEKKNLGSDRTQGRLTGQQNQAQSPSSCEHDNSQFKGKEWIEHSQDCKCGLEQYKKTTVLWMTSPVSCDKGHHCHCSVAQSFLTLCDPIDGCTPGLPVPHHLPEFAQVHVHCIGDAISHLTLWCPLLLLPSIFPRTRDFSNESAVRIRRPKYWSFCFSISPSNEYSGLISLKTDWFDLLAVQGTFKSPVQHCSSKASILRCSEGAWCRDIKNFSEVITGEEQLPILIYPSIKKKTLYFIVNISPCVYVLSSTNSDWTETEVDMWMLLNFPFPSSLARGKERRWEWIWGLEEAGSRGCLSSCVSGETWARKVVICFPSTHSWGSAVHPRTPIPVCFWVGWAIRDTCWGEIWRAEGKRQPYWFLC